MTVAGGAVPKVVFRSALSLLGLTTGIKLIDRLVGGLRPGWLCIFYGSSLCHTIAERLCVRAQLPESEGGLDTVPLWIDGGNSFDPYLLSDLAREHGLRPDEVLNRMIVSRAFTVYQLLHLTKSLPEIMGNHGSRFGAVSNVFDMFVDDVKEKEAGEIVREMGRALKLACRAKDATILVTAWNDPKRLHPLILKYADLVVKMVVSRGSTDASILLLKHPDRPPSQASTVEDGMVRWDEIRTIYHGW